MKTRTQVGIVGAGPAGLLLSHLLQRAGIDSVVLEVHDRAYVEHRIRAGVLEQGTVDILDETGLGERMHRQGLLHRGIYLRFGGRSRRIDFVDLAGKSVMVYGQHEVVKDLIAARLGAGGDLRFESSDVLPEDLATARPTIRYRDRDGVAHDLACDFVAGCDGFHGVCRSLIPARGLQIYERVYPFSWLGILAESPPVSEELIYTNHERGFALVSMRSPTISRLYLQCPAGDDVAAWTDERFWSELRARLAGADAPAVIEGPVLQKGVTPMRSFVAEPMRWGSLFLAGDAAHIVPPTGAKGMNLAVSDVRVLAAAFERHYAHGSDAGLDAYSETCLRRVWSTQRFSWWMTSMLHRFPGRSEFDARLQQSELDYVTGSRAASQSLAENYVGLPMS